MSGLWEKNGAMNIHPALTNVKPEAIVFLLLLRLRKKKPSGFSFLMARWHLKCSMQSNMYVVSFTIETTCSIFKKKSIKKLY